MFFAIDDIHISAEDKTTVAQKFQKWPETVPEATMLHRDGSRSDKGGSSGWFITQQSHGLTTVLTKGYCNLGQHADIIDAKIQAIKEGIE